jgi:hypothetical protein
LFSEPLKESKVFTASADNQYSIFIFTPALAPVMRQRSFLIILALFAIVQVGLTAAG